MIYNTITPGVNLRAFVKCYWTLEAPATTNAEKQRIVPDGCMEMIFNYGDRYRQYIDEENFILQPASFVFGQITKALDIEPSAVTGIFAIRFLPGGFIPFATVPIPDMENRAVPLPELFGEAGHQLEQAVIYASTNAERVKLVEAFLTSRVMTAEAIDGIIKSCVELMLQENGQLSVDELSGHAKINRRQLERKFASTIGLSPKQLSKIIRLQTTLKMLASKQFTSLTAVAYEGDYYDQAHFIKDFKEFTGMSPKKFYADNLKMSSLFSGAE